MPCIVDISPIEEVNHYQVLLCQACKYLTPEEIDGLKNPGSGINDGLYWYTRHLACDYSRRCFNKEVLNFSFETNDEEKKAILFELQRIGYDLIIKDGSIELIKKHTNS